MSPLIAIVDADLAFAGQLAKRLEQQGYRVATVDTIDGARGLLSERRVSILLTELRVGRGDGMKLVAAAPTLSPGTRVVVMTALASAEDYKRAIRLGAVELLTKPFTVQALMAALQTASDSFHGFRGSLHGIDLIDVLQLLHMERRSVSIRIGQQGTIHMRDGEIVAARLGAYEGVQALDRLLSTNSGLIETRRFEKPERTISEPFNALILDTLRRICFISSSA